MKSTTNGFLRGVNIFFSTVGVMVVAGLIVVFLTNAAGIGTLLSVVGLVETQSLYNTTSEQMFEGAAAGIVASLDDPYSTYLDRETWQELKLRLEAKFGGIGVYVFQDEDGKIKIFSPIEGTPAFKEGLQHGDIITKINGESTLNMTQDIAVDLMRGDPGTQLDLTVYRESEGKEIEFRLTREIINVPSVEDKVVDEQANIGYVRLTQFSATSAQEMTESINRLIKEEGIQSLILDLRNNGGGDFAAAISISSIFLDGDEVVSAVNANGEKQVYNASPGKINLPVVVLVNNASASASEILAAALQDNKRAILVGETTYGKGLVQTVFPLRDGGALKLTTQKYYTPRGTDINEIGVVPDHIVASDPENEEDLPLDKAIELLKK